MKTKTDSTYVLNKSEFTQIGVSDKIETIEIEAPDMMIAVTETNMRVTINTRISSLPLFNMMRTSDYFTHHFVNVSQMNDGEYKVQAHVRGFGGGGKNSKPNKSRFPLLHKAAEAGDVETVLRLIAEGHDVNEQINDKSLFDGQTPLYFAVYRNKPKCVEALLKAGADLAIKPKNAYWKPALEVAQEKGYTDVIILLKTVKSNVISPAIQTIINNMSSRALSLAFAKTEDREKLKTLLANALLAEPLIISELSATDDEVILAQEAVAKQLASEIPIVLNSDREEDKILGLKMAVLRGWAEGKKYLPKYQQQNSNHNDSSSSTLGEIGKSVAKDAAVDLAKKAFGF